jgi:hypothetical protein
VEVKVEKDEDEQNEEKKEEDEEPKYKTYVAVYELPSMKMTQDSDGNRNLIPVEGLTQFSFLPGRNIMVLNSFPEGDNQMPRTIFMEIPSRT